MAFLLRRVYVLFAIFILFQLSLSIRIPHKETIQDTTGSFHAYDYGFDAVSFMKRQSPGSLAVTGAKGGDGPNGSLPVRMEIRELEKDTDLWTLYILGLSFMQWTSQENAQSWYQISGIHGRPYVPWDGVESTTGAQSGYCTHTSVLFPTWHRPYLALYEQILYQNIQSIASWYPANVRDRYMAAASNFRIPYWDWAAIPPSGQSVFPDSVSQNPGISVDGPSGTQMIANPLYSYRFKPLDTTMLPDWPLDQWSETMRYPTSSSSDAVSQNNLARTNLNNNAPSLRQRLYRLLAMYNDYTTFSNEAWLPDGPTDTWDSIESVHDVIHVYTGWNAHMAYIDYSAFDPVFFLHHAMMDRIFALWQVINPDSFVVPEPSKMTSFTAAAGEIQDASTPLMPFHSDNSGNFWDSNSARYTSTFRYAYPETANVVGGSTEEFQASVRTAINILYSSITAAAKLKTREEMAGRGVTYQEWMVNIRVQKHALQSSFFVYLFLGSINNDSSGWSFDPNLVGTQGVFTKASCATCNNSQLVTSTIPLNHALEQKITDGSLQSLDSKDVKEYLACNLKYRVTRTDQSEVSNLDVDGLEIYVIMTEVQEAVSDDKFPTWGAATEQFAVDATQ